MEKKHEYLYCQSQIEDEVKRCKKQCKDCVELQGRNLDRVAKLLEKVKHRQ